MAIQIITVPDIGDFDEVEIIELLVSPGDSVEEDDGLIVLESDKATMDVPAPIAGKIVKLLVAEGDKVKEGTPIAEMDMAENTTTPSPAQAEPGKAEAITTPISPTPETQPAATLTVPSTASNDAKPVNQQSLGAKYHASPSVRAFARKLGVELANVTGSAHKGRITQTDVESYVKAVLKGEAKPATTTATGTGIPPVPVIDFSKYGEIETVELKRIQKISGQHLHTAWLNVPNVTQFDETDITELEAFRKSLKPQAEKQGIRITPLVFTMKAVAQALKEFPRFNASLSPDVQSLILKQYINIGIAVDTPNGLMVPVFNDVDQKGIFELSQELMDVSAKARDGKLKPQDLQGGTFSISSLGGIGGTQFTPIVNAPEVAILGVSKASMQPVWNGSKFKPRLIMPYSLSYDHRVIDGAEGVRFTTRLGQLMNDIRHLIL